MNVHQILKNSPFFHEFTSDELTTLERLFQIKTFKQGELIFEEGSPGNEMYILLSGQINVFKSGPRDTVINITSFNRPGEIFGEMAILDGQPRSASIKSVSDTTLLTLTRDDVYNRLQSSPHIFFKVLEYLSVRFREFNDRYLNEILEKNEELELANEELRSLDKMKTTFITMASHELRTPLTCITTTMDILKDSPGNLKTYIPILEKCVMRLSKLIDNVIVLAHGNSGYQITKTAHPIRDVIQEVIDELKPIAVKRNHTLQAACHDGATLIPMSTEHIRQVLINLVMNAIKFTNNGGTITVYTKGVDGGTEIGVIDNGDGIPESERENIFKSFYELSDINFHSSGTYEYNASGLGIGLSIAQNFIQMHGSTIQVDSNIDKGSRFYFTLSNT